MRVIGIVWMVISYCVCLYMLYKVLTAGNNE